ncbi:Uncharacterized protein Fot_12368 [Forsythia ovata]|uniref:Uncharacterized protein n=1 Tax=Forsythia ovata TaxID=205694 RepID=A0ABD1WQ55_9LAMI
MALATIYTTATPAAAAAIGLCFFVRNHSSNKETGVRGFITKFSAEVKKEVKSGQIPKLAPHFDGLYCFETLIYNFTQIEYCSTTHRRRVIGLFHALLTYVLSTGEKEAEQWRSYSSSLELLLAFFTLYFNPSFPKYSVDNLRISDLTLNFDLEERPPASIGNCYLVHIQCDMCTCRIGCRQDNNCPLRSRDCSSFNLILYAIFNVKITAYNPNKSIGMW